MTSHPIDHPPAPSGRSPLDGLWAGIAIAAIWLAVLAIGLWGGDIQTSTGSGGGTATSLPVVAVVAPCALLATIAVARRARP